jgi:ATP-binding cassette subfamily B protein
MVPRLYDPDEGEVLVDGINVKNYSLFNLREGIATVLQKNTLFAGTVAENLRWGKEDATDEELVHACSVAQAHGFISAFPEGYDTEIGREGSRLSGGQKQRVCIARALLKSPKIIILDDSTSAVDTATDASIRRAFREELGGVTKLIIAQRISSVRDADKILVLDEGRLVGVGNHDSLMQSCEAYREIYYSQNDSDKQNEEVTA